MPLDPSSPIAPYQFKAGQPAPPGAGRPRGFKAVAAAIMKATGDGEELVKWAIECWLDPEGRRSFAEKWQAFQWLSDRGLGRPVAMVDMHVDAVATSAASAFAPRLDELSDSELEVLAKLGLGAGGGNSGELALLPPKPGAAPGATVGEIIDTTATEVVSPVLVNIETSS